MDALNFRYQLALAQKYFFKLFNVFKLFTLCCKERTLLNRWSSLGFTFLSCITFQNILLNSSSTSQDLCSFLALFGSRQSLSCSNKRLQSFFFCHSSRIVLDLDTLSLHFLADCIPNSVLADWLCNKSPLCCTLIWVVLSLDTCPGLLHSQQWSRGSTL